MKDVTGYFIALLAIYIAFMIWSVFKSRKDKYQERNSLTALMGMMTFVATLFSTFTLMGMPDFFRNHGIGAWIFLGITDVAMAFLVLWFGLKVREFSINHGFNSISDVLNGTYGGTKAQVVYLLGIFIFLIPYVSIQLHGISLFFYSIWGIPEPVMSFIILLAIFSIIKFGGFGAIVRSDAIQWVVVFISVWIVGYFCLEQMGGFSSGIQKIEASNAAWLSTPGPKGLFSWEFLVASFIAIILMPISQPQLAWRVSNFRDERELRLGAVGIGIFSFLVILPTLFIGMYGAVFLSEASAPVFWKTVLVDEQPPFIAALVMVGLLAAAMSTADSQLHSLRREFTGTNSSKALNINGVFILLIFFVSAYLLSLVASSELILLARISFAGTALVAPMVLIAFLTKDSTCSRYIPLISGLAILTFILSSFGVFPNSIFGLRMDLLLIVIVFISSFSLYFYSKEYRKGEGNE